MNILFHFVTALTKEEVRHFKLYMNRMYDTKDRKDIQLFDSYRKLGPKVDDDMLATKIYQAADKNAFYRLKNRILDELGKNLTLQHSDKNDINQLLQLYSLYQIFKQRNQFELSLHYLKKAERKAKVLEQFEMLDLIYSSFIKLSSELLEINPEEYILLQKQNAERLNHIRMMDQAIAVMLYKVKTTQNYGSERSILTDVETTVKIVSGTADLANSKAFQFRMYRAVSQALLQQHKYKELFVYVNDSFKRFEKLKWFDKNNHESKLQMLIYAANALFKIGDYELSLRTTENLGKEMDAWGGVMAEKYFFYYYNLLYINYSQVDLNRALKVLDEMEAKVLKHRNAYHEQFICLNRATLLYEQKKFNQAIKQLVKLYLNDSYRNAASSFKLKIGVAELIMQYESGDREALEIRLEQVKKQFKETLISPDYKREKDLIAIMSAMTKSADAHDKKTKKLISRFLQQDVEAAVEDAEVLKYSRWLKHYL